MLGIAEVGEERFKERFTKHRSRNQDNQQWKKNDEITDQGFLSAFGENGE